METIHTFLHESTTPVSQPCHMTAPFWPLATAALGVGTMAGWSLARIDKRAPVKASASSTTIALNPQPNSTNALHPIPSIPTQRFNIRMLPQQVDNWQKQLLLGPSSPSLIHRPNIPPALPEPTLALLRLQRLLIQVS